MFNAFRAASAKGGDDAIFRCTITSYLRKQIPRLSSRERERERERAFEEEFAFIWK